MGDYIHQLRRLVGTRPLITCGACVILLDSRGRILLQRRADNGAWGLPGGSMEPGETLEQTARRETLEEMGIVCGPLEFLHLFSGPEMYYRYPHGDEAYNVAAVYVCRRFEGQDHPADDEVTETAWFAPADLPPDISPPDRVILSHFLAHDD